MIAMLSPSLSASAQPDRLRPSWSRAQVRLLVLLVSMFVVHVAASVLYVLGG